MFSISQITSETEFYSLQQEWNHLVEQSRSNTIALTWEWLYTWWEIYKQGRKLFVLTVRDQQNTLAGIAPFGIRTVRGMGAFPLRRIEILGTGENRKDGVYSEYLDLIARKEKEEEVIEAIADYLVEENNFLWDEIYLESILEDSAMAGLGEAIADRGHRSKKYEKEKCFFISLPKDYDSYFNKLSNKLKYNLRRGEKRLKEIGTFEFAKCTSEKDLDEEMERFIALHQKRWRQEKQPGSFSSRRFTLFHKRIAPLLFKKEYLVLNSLKIDGKAVACLYGFRYGQKLFFYLGGFDPTYYRNLSLGSILQAFSIREAIHEKLKEFDFLRGDEHYKSAWANQFRRNIEIYLWNKNMKGEILFIKFVLLKWIKNKVKSFFKIVNPFQSPSSGFWGRFFSWIYSLSPLAMSAGARTVRALRVFSLLHFYSILYF